MTDHKYMIVKVVDGTMIETSFFLLPNKDPAAVKAMQTYAAATDNKALADDIYAWVGKPKEQTLEQVIQERDCLMKIVHDVVGCSECVHEANPLEQPPCNECGILGLNWKWRGAEKGSDRA